MQKLADYTGLEIMVSHYPPGASKWNKIEHRMFCYISKNWQGKPLIDIETVVSLISNTTTQNGLKIDCLVDNNVFIREKLYLFLKHCMICRYTVSKNNTINTIILKK